MGERRWTVTTVAPLRTEKRMAFVCPGGLREVDWPVYPDSPKGDELRELRHKLCLTLSQVTRRTGLSPSEYSGLEFGRYTLPEGEWPLLFAAVEGVRRG